MEAWKDKLKLRIRRRQDYLNAQAEKLIFQVEAGRMDRGYEIELEREWLEQFAQVGEGLNLCCGHLGIGNSYGVDVQRYFAADYVLPIDSIDKFNRNSFDYIISNHLESSEFVLKVFCAMFDILKPDGVLALVFFDTDAEANSAPDDDVMNSPKKIALFSRSIMRRYLLKAGFFEENIEFSEATSPKFLRVVARKCR